MNRCRQRRIFIVGLALMAISFPRMFVRSDEKHLVRDNFGLDLRDGDGKPHDGLEDGFDRIGDGTRELHDRKNIVHEWVKARPKLAAKFLPFLALCCLIVGLLAGVAIGVAA